MINGPPVAQGTNRINWVQPEEFSDNSPQPYSAPPNNPAANQLQQNPRSAAKKDTIVDRIRSRLF
jgi:hypothetical protein